MKPLTQFEKMRANRQKLAEVRRVAAREAFLQSLDSLRPSGRWVYADGRPFPDGPRNDFPPVTMEVSNDPR